MALISPATFLRRVAASECLFSGRSLRAGEALVSKEQFPQLYALAPWGKDSLNLLRGLIETLVTLKGSGKASDSRIQMQLEKAKPFLQLLLHQKDAVPEYCVHAFIYLYWNDIEYRNAAILPAGNIYFSSAALSAVIEPSDPYFRLIARLKDVTNVDLIAISEELQHIFLIEIKRGPLDDRAIGQVLRYFNESNKLLTDRVVREFNLSYVRPVLVLGEVSRHFFEAFPLHFREFLDIYEYDTERDESDSLKVVLHNLRRRILSAAMQ